MLKKKADELGEIGGAWDNPKDNGQGAGDDRWVPLEDHRANKVKANMQRKDSDGNKPKSKAPWPGVGGGGGGPRGLGGDGAQRRAATVEDEEIEGSGSPAAVIIVYVWQRACERACANVCGMKVCV